MRPIDDVARGDWIAPRLTAWGPASGVVPTGYAAYARVLHPVRASRVVSEFPFQVEERRMRWADVAATLGRVMHPAVQWEALVGIGAEQPVGIGDDWTVDAPVQGRLELEQLAALAGMLGSGAATAAVWDGWGELRPGDAGILTIFEGPVFDEPAIPGDDDADREQRTRDELLQTVSPEVARHQAIGPWLALPGRDYLVFDCAVEEFADPSWTESAGIGWHWGHGPTPNLLWPADASWCLATEIDFDSTLLGGTRELIDAVLAHPQLESLEIGPTTDLSSTGDRING